LKGRTDPPIASFRLLEWTLVPGHPWSRRLTARAPGFDRVLSVEREEQIYDELFDEAANYLQRGIAADVERETGLPGTWFEILVRLHRTPGHATRMNEMAAQVSFPPSSFSRLIDRMEAEHLVERGSDPTNRRATLIQATTSGEDRLLEALAVHQRSAGDRLADHLSAREIDALEAITRKIRDANAPGQPSGTADLPNSLAG
jgi:DNA-binding MarR family transcriptional regulator